MTLSAFISRWFGVTLASNAGFGSDAFVLANEPYEEEDQYRLDGDDGDSQDSPSDYEEDDDGTEADDYFRPSRFFASHYEEEADHRRDAGLLDVDELVLE